VFPKDAAPAADKLPASTRFPLESSVDVALGVLIVVALAAATSACVVAPEMGALEGHVDPPAHVSVPPLAMLSIAPLGTFTVLLLHVSGVLPMAVLPVKPASTPDVPEPPMPPPPESIIQVPFAHLPMVPVM
jgi:hypothetical protein